MAPAPITQMNVGHIDDVQELRKTQSTTVPDRFMRDVDEIDSVISDSPISKDVPIIDLSKIAKGSYDEIIHLASACEEWGFFQVINHGVDTKILEKMEKLSMDFFKQPIEEKQKYKMAPGTVQGYGQAFVFSEQQKLDWCNMFALGIHPHFIRNPSLWPTKPLNFSESIEAYTREIRILCEKLLRCIAVSLGLRAERFEEMFGEAVQAIRMNYYPPCPRPDLVLGLSPHSDGSALTILQQKQGSSIGLQLLKDNKWVSIHPIPGALVVNIGDTLEVLTNGKYKSVEHRAVTNMVKDRLSIVTFYAPSYEVELGPMPEFVDESNPVQYRNYLHGEYSKHYVTNKLQGKRTLEFAKLGTHIPV
ncbi:protein SRG1-like [Chenopodium quinoa]|uniref:Fe2OG dioxygenase domain-containing protein n=1 Tax=Chenopodium quinoa TaxID=63459 RepID=A0A803LM52_CHEQI|nr:protein SRG1-like [Chenopodium quinoa]